MYALIHRQPDHDVTIVERSSSYEYLYAIQLRIDDFTQPTCAYDIVPLSERTAVLSRPVALFVSGLGMMGDMPTIEPTDAELDAIELEECELIHQDEELWPWYRPGYVNECEEYQLEQED